MQVMIVGFDRFPCNQRHEADYVPLSQEEFMALELDAIENRSIEMTGCDDMVAAIDLLLAWFERFDMEPLDYAITQQGFTVRIRQHAMGVGDVDPDTYVCIMIEPQRPNDEWASIAVRDCTLEIYQALQKLLETKYHPMLLERSIPVTCYGSDEVQAYIRLTGGRFRLR